jgi:hypothetical protein
LEARLSFEQILLFREIAQREWRKECALRQAAEDKIKEVLFVVCFWYSVFGMNDLTITLIL